MTGTTSPAPIIAKARVQEFPSTLTSPDEKCRTGSLRHTILFNTVLTSRRLAQCIGSWAPCRLRTTATTETECRVEFPIDGLRHDITCGSCHLSFCKVRLKPARHFHALRSPQETMAYRMVPACLCVRCVKTLTNGHSFPLALTSLQSAHQCLGFPCLQKAT